MLKSIDGGGFANILELRFPGSFSSLRGSKEAMMGVPGRSFYEVLRFLQKTYFRSSDFFYG